MSAAARPVAVGVVGCGKISAAYLKQCRQFPMLEVSACADLMPDRAAAMAAEFEVPRSMSPAELLADDSIELVVNLTIPAAHHAVSLAAIRAGKHVWVEKPLAVELAHGKELVEAAATAGVLLGCAPDTFLGGGHQTCRKLIDDGWIGTPLHATAFMTNHGHEHWHPDPGFYYRRGGGPMFDMGPYYLTALIHLLGPVARVTGLTRTSFPQRTVSSEPLRGEVVEVEVATHVQGLLEFAGGAQAMILTSFEVWGAHLPRVEIYGTAGSLAVPDPNGPGGEVQVLRGRGEWQATPLSHGYTELSRSIGVADMAAALRAGRPHRASGALALHVLEVMHAIHQAADSGSHVQLSTSCERPQPLPLGLETGQLDLPAASS